MSLSSFINTLPREVITHIGTFTKEYEYANNEKIIKYLLRYDKREEILNIIEANHIPLPFLRTVQFLKCCPFCNRIREKQIYNEIFYTINKCYVSDKLCTGFSKCYRFTEYHYRYNRVIHCLNRNIKYSIKLSRRRGHRIQEPIPIKPSDIRPISKLEFEWLLYICRLDGDRYDKYFDQYHIDCETF